MGEQLQKLFNGKWDIQYNEFDNASIVLDFDSAKDYAESSMKFTKIGLVLSFNKINEETNSKEVCMNYKKAYENE